MVLISDESDDSDEFPDEGDINEINVERHHIPNVNPRGSVFRRNYIESYF